MVNLVNVDFLSMKTQLFQTSQTPLTRFSTVDQSCRRSVDCFIDVVTHGLAQTAEIGGHGQEFASEFVHFSKLNVGQELISEEKETYLLIDIYCILFTICRI